MRPDPHLRGQRGVLVVELALVLLVFLTFMLGVVEVARAMFLLNTTQEVTRRAARAAALADFSDGPALAALKQDALFRNSDGALALAPDITTANVRVEYLSMNAAGAMAPATPLPACPEANIVNCTADPTSPSCIRFVRVSICTAQSGACTGMPYQGLTGLVPGLSGFNLPTAATVVKAESLGYRPGTNACL